MNISGNQLVSLSPNRQKVLSWMAGHSEISARLFVTVKRLLQRGLYGEAAIRLHENGYDAEADMVWEG